MQHIAIMSSFQRGLNHVGPQWFMTAGQQWRHACGGLVVVAANAGGAWSPIGDVTTTMLWIQHKAGTTGGCNR